MHWLLKNGPRKALGYHAPANVFQAGQGRGSERNTRRALKGGRAPGVTHSVP